MLTGQTTYGKEGGKTKQSQHLHSYFPCIMYAAHGDIETRL